MPNKSGKRPVFWNPFEPLNVGIGANDQQQAVVLKKVGSETSIYSAHFKVITSPHLLQTSILGASTTHRQKGSVKTSTATTSPMSYNALDSPIFGGEPDLRLRSSDSPEMGGKTVFTLQSTCSSPKKYEETAVELQLDSHSPKIDGKSALRTQLANHFQEIDLQSALEIQLARHSSEIDQQSALEIQLARHSSEIGDSFNCTLPVEPLYDQNEKLHLLQIIADADSHIEKLELMINELKKESGEAHSEYLKIQETAANLSLDLKDAEDRIQMHEVAVERQEMDFRLFSRKIQTLQSRNQILLTENDSLKASVRQLQFEPSKEDMSYKERWEQGVHDNDALKFLLYEMKAELDELTENRALENNLPTHVDYSSRTLENKSPNLIRHDMEYISPMGNIFPNQTKAQENRTLYPVRDQVGESPGANLATLSPMKLENNHSGKWANSRHSAKNRETENYDDYFERKTIMDNQLSRLTQQKSGLIFEQSRIPSHGGSAKSRKRIIEIDDLLDKTDLEISSTRKLMRDYGLL